MGEPAPTEQIPPTERMTTPSPSNISDVHRVWLAEAWSNTFDGQPSKPIKVDPLQFDVIPEDQDKQDINKEGIDEETEFIRPLMMALHNQFRERVERSFNEQTKYFEEELAIQDNKRGCIGSIQVIKLEQLAELYNATFARVINERLGRVTSELFATFKERCTYFATNHVTRNIMKTNDPLVFLQLLAATSRNFSTYMECSLKPLMCLDSTRAYSAHENKPCIRTNALEKFYDDVYSAPDVKERLFKAMIHEYRLLRMHPTRSRQVYKDVIEHFFDFMYSYYDSYHKEFQECLINEATCYYTAMTQYFLKGTCPDQKYFDSFPSFAKDVGTGDQMNLKEYIQIVSQLLKVERTLQEEVHKYKTVSCVLAVVEYFLIDLVVDVIFTHEALTEILIAMDEESLKQIFEMFRKNNSALTILAKAFKDHVIRDRQRIIETIQKGLVKTKFDSWESEGGIPAIPQMQVIEKLLKQYKVEERIIKEVFNSDFLLSGQLKDARELIAAIPISGINQHELLPMYISLLCYGELSGTGSRSREEVKGQIKEACEYYSFLANKDAFMAKHTDLVAHRILFDKADYELEQLVLSELKERTGPASTHKLDVMLGDGSRFKTLTSEFLASNVLTNDIEVDVKIVTKGPWPLDKLGYMNEVQLNPTLADINKKFYEFYAARYPSRVLEFMHRWCIAELEFSPRQSATYKLKVDGHQASLLMMFDVKDEYAQDELAELQIEDTLYLEKLVDSLCSPSCPILMKSNGAIKLNREFTSSSNECITVPRPVITRPVVNQEVAQDETYALQANIVIYMKKCGCVTYDEIVRDVLPELATKITVTPEAVDQALEDLMRRGYMKRSETDENAFIFV